MGSPNKCYYKSQSSHAGNQSAHTLIEITDTGFKAIGYGNNSNMNHSGSNYSYYAIPESSSSSSGGSSSNSPGIKAWGVFDGTDAINTEMTLKAGSNVASILKTSSGVYKVTMTNPMPSEHYSVSVDCNPWGTSGAYAGVNYEYNGDTSSNPTTTTFIINCRNHDNVNVSPNRVTFQVAC